MRITVAGVAILAGIAVLVVLLIKALESHREPESGDGATG